VVVTGTGRARDIDGSAFLQVESDPLAIKASSTAAAYTNAGGSYETNAIVCTSGLLTNGVASVSADKAGYMRLLWEISTNGTDWAAYAETDAAAYVRLSVENDPPGPGDITTSVSNVVVNSWTRPDLYRQTADTAGQIIHVDTATEARQPVPLAQMQSVVSAVSPSEWASYRAVTNVNLGGHKIILGGGWSVQDVSGVGVLSYADWMTTTNSLTIANNGTAVIVMVPGMAGLEIATFAVDGGTGTVGIATNGVSSDPFLQWTADLMQPEWQVLVANLRPTHLRTPPGITRSWRRCQALAVLSGRCAI